MPINTGGAGRTGCLCRPCRFAPLSSDPECAERTRRRLLRTHHTFRIFCGRPVRHCEYLQAFREGGYLPCCNRHGFVHWLRIVWGAKNQVLEKPVQHGHVAVHLRIVSKEVLPNLDQGAVHVHELQMHEQHSLNCYTIMHVHSREHHHARTLGKGGGDIPGRPTASPGCRAPSAG